MSFIGFIFLFVCSVFMYRHSPYLDLGNISDEDYDGMGGSTRGAAYVYLLIFELFYFIGIWYFYYYVAFNFVYKERLLLILKDIIIITS